MAMAMLSERASAHDTLAVKSLSVSTNRSEPGTALRLVARFISSVLTVLFLLQQQGQE
jgi:hypothetical protein